MSAVLRAENAVSAGGVEFPAADGLPDCRSCGACCCHRWSWPVLRRDRSDAVEIPGWMLRGDLPLLRTVGGRCVGLLGVSGREVACSVYNVRPEACRNFVRGGVLCREALKGRKMSEPLEY